MTWYNNLKFNFENEVKRLGLIFNGPQEWEGKIVGNMFTDKETGSSFLVRTGQDIEKSLNEMREKFL